MKATIRQIAPVLFGGFFAVVSAAGEPDVRYAARATVALRQGKYAFDPVVATVARGQQVSVIGRDGRWLRVSFTPVTFSSTSPAIPLEGYVLEDALASQPATQPADTKTVLASGGVLNSSDFAATNGLDPDAMAKAVADSQKAMQNADAKFEAFRKAGGLGAKKTPVPATQPAN